MKRRALATLWHLLPLLPLFFGHYYAATGACLLVAMPYIKAAKLNTMLVELGEKYPEPRATAVLTEIKLLEKKRRRWAYLTLSSHV